MREGASQTPAEHQTIGSECLHTPLRGFDRIQARAQRMRTHRRPTIESNYTLESYHTGRHNQYRIWICPHSNTDWLALQPPAPPLGPIAEGLAARSLGGCAHSFDPRAQEKRRWNRAYNLNLPGIRCLSMYMALRHLMEYQFIHKRWVWKWNK